jgi:hypothetical protein
LPPFTNGGAMGALGILGAGAAILGMVVSLGCGERGELLKNAHRECGAEALQALECLVLERFG